MANVSYGFDDLYRAAYRRDMTGEERAQFGALTQPERNAAVRELAGMCHGVFACEDRTGSDSQTYTAFLRLDDPPDGMDAEGLILRRVTLACLDLVHGSLVLIGMRKAERDGVRMLVADYAGGILIHVYLYDSAKKPIRGEIFHRDTPELSLPLAKSELSHVLGAVRP